LVGRIFSDTFAGIAPASRRHRADIAPTSALVFIGAALAGVLVGLGLVRLFPDAPVTAGLAVVPHPNYVPKES
jgi:hypothetical protein